MYALLFVFGVLPLCLTIMLVTGSNPSHRKCGNHFCSYCGGKGTTIRRNNV